MIPEVIVTCPIHGFRYISQRSCPLCNNRPLADWWMKGQFIQKSALAASVSPSVGKESKSHDDDGESSTRAPGEEHQGP
jgi:hypothetical protein